jgi:hypothetical protein
MTAFGMNMNRNKHGLVGPMDLYENHVTVTALSSGPTEAFWLVVLFCKPLLTLHPGMSSHLHE